MSLYYFLLFHLRSHIKNSCFVFHQGFQTPRNNKSTRPTAPCFHYFLGVWNPWWNTRTRFWYITSQSPIIVLIYNNNNDNDSDNDNNHNHNNNHRHHHHHHHHHHDIALFLSLSKSALPNDFKNNSTININKKKTAQTSKTQVKENSPIK